ncbi:MAG: methyltransferase domain-containing protein, partial [Bacteroidales bacterium]|nr:methyltransferase domain-containing protein [Bacteroidales bacterium]
LDCSCGSGLQAIGLAKEGYEVEGGDLSANMIDKAKQSAVEAG